MDTETNVNSLKLNLLVGTYTNQESRGIYRFEFDPQTGALSSGSLVAESSNPSYLIFSKDRRIVYSVNEDLDGEISSYKWGEAKEKLELVSQRSSKGGLPCHLELNAKGDLLAVSNYWTGDFSIFEVDMEGHVSANPIFIKHTGEGPVRPNQNTARGHCMKFSPDDQFLYAVDLGADKIVSYPISEKGPIALPSFEFKLDPGDGPRHLVFHPSRNLAFVANELSGSVTSMRIDHETGAFQRIDKKDTYPDGYVGKRACADIHTSADGRFLYVSNRVDDSIAIFSVAEDGNLERLAIEPVRGSWPRSFTFSPDGRFLISANQKSDNVTVFSVDERTGLLSFTGCEVKASIPVVVKF